MKLDKTDEILRRKLHDIEVSRDVPSWDEFRPKLKRKSVIKQFVPYLTAAVAVLAVMFLIFNHDYDHKLNSIESIVAESISADSSVVVVQQAAMNDTEVVPPTYAMYSTARTKVSKRNEKVESVQKPELVELDSSDIDSKGNSQSAVVKKEESTKKLKTPSRPYIEPSKERSSKRKTRTSPLIAMTPFVSLGSAIGSVQSQPRFYSALSGVSAVVSDMNYVQMGQYKRVVNFQNNDFSHDMPISFGVGVDFSLTERFSIGSGLVYSYLKSKATSYESFTYKYTQQVNYIGVPINASYKIVKGKVLDVYGKVGVMAEMSVASSARTDVYRNDSFLSSEVVDFSPDGLQMSFNAGVGLNVNVSSLIGIYVEPGLSHYIKNDNHPLTYYTQSPLKFNLRAGMKFQF